MRRDPARSVIPELLLSVRSFYGLAIGGSALIDLIGLLILNFRCPGKKSFLDYRLFVWSLAYKLCVAAGTGVAALY